MAKNNKLLTLTGVMLSIMLCATYANAAEAEFSLDTGSGILQGTLLLPSGTGPFPVALIIAGSGPTDRDGNAATLPGKNNSLKMLAESLAQQGIATLRYDKRGIGASARAGTDEASLRFDHYVDDAAGWLALLAEDGRFSRQIIIGHSEGSLIGMRAAQRFPAAIFISIAGPAAGAADVLRQQLRAQLPPVLLARNEEILQALESGQMTADIPPELLALYRPSVQPYLISWMQYIPTDEVARLSAPCLILQGDNDIQIGVAAAEALQQARPACELGIISGMNHVMKRVSADMQQQIASYSDPTLPLASELVDALERFLGRALQ